MVRVSLVGAHTAVAKALVECIEERELGVDLTLAAPTELLSEGFVPIDDKVLSSADLVVLAFRERQVRHFAEAARSMGTPVLDLAEALADEKTSRWIFPGIDPEAGASFDPMLFSVVPLGVGAPIVSILRAFSPLEPSRAIVVTYESAAALDQPGMDELSDQVRARFQMRDVEPRVFAGAIGFGSIPLVGAPGDSPFEADDRLRRAIEAGLETHCPELELVITRALVPTFTADSAVLIIEVDRTPTLEDARRALRGARGIHDLGEKIASSIDAVGRDDALCGRLSIEEGVVSLWLACDRLRRGSATLGALAIERWLTGRAGS